MLFKDFKKDIDFTSKETIHGNTALHMACLQENLEVAQLIFKYKPQLCMRPNSFGRSPFFLACQTACETKRLQLLEIFESMKTQAIVVQDYLGENMLFMCARSSAVEVFNWFQGTDLETYNNFFRARGQQNYKGQSIEHVVCIEGKTNIVQDIRPKLDTKDYYGNLPIHYTIANNDYQMVLNYFTKCKAYFDLRNFKNETIFHIAAKHNSLRSIKAILGKTVFVEEMLKRDFKGDTPLHAAAKAGSYDVLEFYLSACTPSFLTLENDFGLTPIQATAEKICILQEKIRDKECSLEAKDKYFSKIEKLQDIDRFFHSFDNFVTDETWAERFELTREQYLEHAEDPNLRVFMTERIQGREASYSPGK